MSVWSLQQYTVLYTMLLGAMTLAADYVTGPYIHFPALFILPVVLASWYRGWPLGLGAAILLPAIRLSLEWHWAPVTPWTMAAPIVNTLVCIAVLSTLAYMTAMASQEKRTLQKQVRILSGLLPICMFCKKIRDDQENWQVLEVYIMRHSEANFSHSLCPSCMQEHYGQYIKLPAGTSEEM